MGTNHKQDKLKALLSDLKTNTEYASELEQAISLIPKNKVRQSLEQDLEIKHIIIKAIQTEINQMEVGGK